jgi:hypothetical protein
MINDKMKIQFLCLAALLLIRVAAAQGGNFQKSGTVGYTFLELPASARQTALSEAVGSLMEQTGILPLFANPGVLGFQQDWVAGLSSSRWLADIQHHLAGIVIPAGIAGRFGIGLNYVDYGTIPLAEKNSTTKIGDYTAQSLAIGITYARQLTHRFAWGIRFNWVSETIYEYSSSNLLLDIGVLYLTGFKSLRIGGYINHFGMDACYLSDAFKMPSELRLGLAYDFLNSEKQLLTLAVEMEHPSDTPERIHLGLEYRFADFLYLRGGCKFQVDEDPYAVGAGIVWKRYLLDFAVVPFGRFPTVYHLTFQKEF